MPPTGPRGGSSTNTRQTRSSTGASRPPARGGIAKRGRGPAPRVDRDGDLVMDAAAANKSGAGINKNNSSTRRGTTRPSGPRANTRLQQNLARQLGGDTSQVPKAPSAARLAANNTTLKVLGVKSSKAATNPDGGEKRLLEFLERKASTLKGPSRRHVTVKKSLVDGDLIYILASNQDAEEILKLNGFIFAGAQLNIAKNEDGWPQAEKNGSTALSDKAQQDKIKLQQVLERRYNPNIKLLDLSALGQDPTLTEMGLFQAKNIAEKTFKVLMVICQDLFKTAQAKRDAIESISLAGNNIDFVGQVFDLAETFPDLKHLDLSNNQLSNLKQLNKWRSRFRHLETLLLNDNPIIQTEPNHAIELRDWFPKLQNLSNIQIRTAEEVAIEAAKAQPKLIPQRGTDFRDVAGLGEQFLRQFFTLYDSNRDELLATFYDEYSTFTLAVVTGGPKDSDTAVLPWAPYLTFSRNHQRITTEAARFQRYIKGIQIQEVWKKLPVTKHPELATNLDKYIIDCHPMKGLHDPITHKSGGEDGMIITMHGEFEELEASTGKTGKRSFSRTFVIGPGLPGRGVMRVISDVLSISPWSPVPSVAISASAPIPPPVPTISPEEQQQLMLVELSKRTNMIGEYSRMCLETAEWNFDRALAVFEERKSVLPPEAFIQA
ncbi:nuclear mRNA export, poly(A)+RNA binding protein [Cytospora paraplurivora]|uniref:mRNA export factor MEX67 n=1 Tax=Cytospora paraplurivora TaxID=2898453 RepID=A0AAN9U764_9PEZI